MNLTLEVDLLHIGFYAGSNMNGRLVPALKGLANAWGELDKIRVVSGQLFPPFINIIITVLWKVHTCPLKYQVRGKYLWDN